MSTTIDGVTFNNGAIVSNSVGASATAAGLVDGTTLNRNSSTGVLSVGARGTTYTGGVPREGMSRYAGARLKGDMVASDAAAGIVSVENDTGVDLVVEMFCIHVKTASSGACTVSAGIVATATDGTNLWTPASVAATGVIGDATVPQLWPSGYYLTLSMASGATSGLVGTYQILFSDMN